MTAFRKTAATGLLAAVLASSLGAAPASAFDQDRLTRFSIELGRIDDGYEYRRPFFGADAKSCHFGRTQMVWRELCKPVGYAVNYCWHQDVAYRPVVCN